jgi:uncharacterized protein YbjQ (UPF0145 family)
MTITEIENELKTQTARRDALSRQLAEGEVLARNSRRELTAAIAKGAAESEVAKLRAASTKAAEHASETADVIPLIVGEISRLEGELETARRAALAEEMTGALEEWGAALDAADAVIVDFFRDVLGPHHAKITDAFNRARQAERELYATRANPPTTSQLEYPDRFAKRSGNRAAAVLDALAQMSEGKPFSMQYGGGAAATAPIKQDARTEIGARLALAGIE